MPFEEREHGGRWYAVQFTYALPDDAWRVELSEMVPVPEWGADARIPGQDFMAALVPDEDPSREPEVHVHSPDGRAVPYEIVCWFMDHVADEVARCRTALEQAAAGGGPGE
ncbi:hypothetical protein [Streptomyces sp. NPDC002889]|uniref:hypothetical protein n=1 Tax=Streptomyces sp. NPDC002889 TaxID=3364669 RepID=UPI0036BC900B